jgi:hypothetical protein
MPKKKMMYEKEYKLDTLKTNKKTTKYKYHFVNYKTNRKVTVTLKITPESSDQENEYYAYDKLADKLKDKTLGRDNPKNWYLDDITM